MAVHDVYVVILIILFHTNERCFCSFTVHKKHCKNLNTEKIIFETNKKLFLAHLTAYLFFRAAQLS